MCFMAVQPHDFTQPPLTQPDFFPSTTINEKVVGTCSLCGGPVVVPTFYWSVNPPTPTCKSCGATKQKDFGPVIPMTPSKPIKWMC